MTKNALDPIQPGGILLEDFMKPLGLSQYKVAKDIGVSPLRISEIVREKRAVTADSAMRLARYFATTAGIWIRLQAQIEKRMTQMAAPIVSRSCCQA